MNGEDFWFLLALARFRPCIINEMAKNTEIEVEHTHGKAPDKFSTFSSVHCAEEPLHDALAPCDAVRMNHWLPIMPGVPPMFEGVWESF